MQNNLHNNIVMFFYAIFCLPIAFPAYAVEVTYVTDVDGTKDGKSGIITSPNYPRNYSDNVNYTWILRTGHPDAIVNLTIMDLDIRIFRRAHCEDYLLITEIIPLWRIALKRCGQFPPFNYAVFGEMISISFVSDKDLSAKGFNLTWKVHLPKLITTWMTTTPLITTTTLPLTLMKTTRTTLATTPSTLNTNATTSQPSSAPITSTLSSPTTKRTPLPKEETSSILTTTKTVATTTTFIASTTQPQRTARTVTTELNTTSTEGKGTPLEPMEIMYLIIGISAAELILIAFGICIIKRRKKDSSTKANNRSRDIQVDNVRPMSRKSVISVANGYESIPLEHFSHDAILEEDEKEEGAYVDLPEHVYDRQFAHRPHRNENVNFYQLISELKNRKA